MGGGFANHAINVIKANRALLNKRKRRKRADYIRAEKKTLIHIKETTPAQMRAVKLRIAANKRRELKVLAICLALSAGIIYGVYLWMKR
ncbi:MAG TPA: hypothetical protein VKN36_00695 [Eudoraea sp.]|nr:hypothetical protein [Eudoraea sp.]